MIKIRNYTSEDLDFIKENYSNLTTKQIANRLHKTESSVYNAIRKMGLKKQVHKAWSEEEIQFLSDHYLVMTNEELAKKLGRSFNSISAQLDRMGLVRNKAWTNDEEQFLIDHFMSMSHKEIGEKLNRTERAITAKCFDLNLYKKDVPWNDHDLEFIKNNYMEMSNKELSQILNRTENAIHLQASRMGLKKYPYFCDYHYFDNIDTEEKAYWLGFLSADGWINRNEDTGSCAVGIELQYADLNHLKKFNKSIAGNYQITDRWRVCSLSKDQTKKHHTCTIRIFSKNMYNSLINLGFSNNKSYDFQFPTIDKKLLRHYIRGYFDGDGCLTVTNKFFAVQFITASESFINSLIALLEELDLHVSHHNYINDFGTLMFNPRLTRNADKLKFLDYIYKDSSIYLDRKYKKYLKAKEKYTNHESLAA